MMKQNFVMRKERIIALALLLCPCVVALAGHVVVRDTLRGSVCYPGTEHMVEVMVPDEYDGTSPACLYVGLDGNLCRAMEVIDSLIVTGDMPVTIGVMVQPGVIKDATGRVLRYNRSNEFDMPDGRFAQFLEAELLPWVERMSTPDGRRIMLSRRPADRMIAGLSSGGIAAFVAAWHRPDLFSRVYTGVGTFVAMRGGNDLQAIVRKHEPQPLRIYLQDGSQDAWNALFGHWYEGNRMLATALEFAGYELSCDWSDGGHNVRRSTVVYPQAMKWLWHGWPEAPQRGLTANNLLQPLLTPDTQWHDATVPGEVGETERALVYYPDSTLAVAPHCDDNCLWQYVVGGDGTLLHGQRFYYLHAYDNAMLTIGPMAFDAAGNLWVVTSAGLQICDQNGRVRGIVALPRAVGADDVTAIHIIDGAVTLDGNHRSWQRSFNVHSPVPGHTPPSQGQG